VLVLSGLQGNKCTLPLFLKPLMNIFFVCFICFFLGEKIKDGSFMPIHPFFGELGRGYFFLVRCV